MKMQSYQLRSLHEALEEELADTLTTSADFLALVFAKRLIADRALCTEAKERAEYAAKYEAEQKAKEEANK